MMPRFAARDGASIPYSLPLLASCLLAMSLASTFPLQALAQDGAAPAGQPQDDPKTRPRRRARQAEEKPAAYRCVQVAADARMPGDIAFDEESGLFAIAEYEGLARKGGSIRVYRPEFFDSDRPGANVLGPLQPPAAPVSLAFAHDGDVPLLAVSLASGQVWVLDARTLEQKRIIALDGEHGSPLSAGVGRAEVMAFGDFTPPGQMRVAALRVLNVVDGTIGPPVPLAVNPGHISMFAVAGDGQSMATVTREGELRLYNADAYPPGLWRHAAQWKSAGRPFVIGPFDRCLIGGHALYDMDLSPPSRVDLPFYALAASRVRPVLIGVRGHILEAASSATLKVLGSVDLDASTPFFGQDNAKKLGRNDPRWDVPRVYIDGPRGRALVVSRIYDAATDGYPALAAVVPLADLDADQEPLLGIAAPTRSHAVVGREFALALSATPGGVLSLASGPDGMSLDGGTLRWTPGAAGESIATIRLEHGGFEVERRLAILSEQPAVALDWEADGLAVSPDGLRAVVWEEGREARDRTLPAIPGRITLIDVGSVRTIASVEVPHGISACAVVGGEVYAGVASQAYFEVRGENLAEVRKVVTKTPVREMLATADRLFVRTGDAVETFKIPGLVRAPELPRPPGDSSFPVAVPEGWAWGGRVYDSAMDRVILLTDVSIEPGSIWTACTRQAKGEWSPQPWGRRIGGTGVQRAETGGGGDQPKSVVKFSGAAGPFEGRRAGYQVLTDAPAVVRLDFGLSNERAGDITTMRRRTWLSFFDLSTGQAEQVPLSCRTQGLAWNNDSDRFLRATDRAIVAADAKDRTVYIVPREDRQTAECAAPLAFRMQQSALAVDLKKKAPLTHAVVGGVAPYRFELLVPEPWLGLDEASGEISIDSGVLLREAPAVFAQLGATNGVGYDWGYEEGLGPRQEAVRRIGVYKAAAASDFADLAGYGVSGLPVALRIGLRVTDARGDTAELRYLVLTDLPAGPFEKPLAEALKPLMPGR